MQSKSYDYFGNPSYYFLEAWYWPERRMVFAQVSKKVDGQRYSGACKVSLEALEAHDRGGPAPEMDIRQALWSKAVLEVGPGVTVRAYRMGNPLDNTDGGEVLFEYQERWISLHIKPMEVVRAGYEVPECASMIVPPISVTTVDVEED